MKNQRRLPAERQRSASPFNAFAVMAMIGICPPANFSLSRIEALEERFKKVLEFIAHYFPEKEKEKENQRQVFNPLEQHIFQYNQKKNNKKFKCFTYDECAGKSLANLTDPIKSLFEEMH